MESDPGDRKTILFWGMGNHGFIGFLEFFGGFLVKKPKIGHFFVNQRPIEIGI